MQNSVGDPEAAQPQDDPPDGSRDGRGHFFAVDRRAWAWVCGLGMNPAVVYLVLARGTGGDNRTTGWSTNAVERRTGIGRTRAAAAISGLERAGLILRQPGGTRSRPKYKIAPAHRVPGCEGCPPTLDDGQRRLLERLGDGWTEVPRSRSASGRDEDEGWGGRWPHRIADELVRLGYAERSPDGRSYLAVRSNAEAAAEPDWIWLPNALVDGAAGETAPVELVRQTGCAWTLRLLVDLYGAQGLDEDGGIRFRAARKQYMRHAVGELGGHVVWGFSPDTDQVWPNAPFAAPHFAAAGGSPEDRTAAWLEFWGRWNRLRGLGLVEVVAHLVNADTDDGEILHPVALEGTGLEVERELRRAASRAAAAMITPAQLQWAAERGVVALVPVPRHIAGVQMVGVVRLRYRALTRRTQAFVGHEGRWRRKIAELDRLVDGAASTACGGHEGVGRAATSRLVKEAEAAWAAASRSAAC